MTLAFFLQVSVSFAPYQLQNNKIKTNTRETIDFHLCLSPSFFHLAPSKPLNLFVTFQKPSEMAMPRMTVQWQQPAEQNGIIRKYRLVFTYTFDGRQTTITSETNNQTFSHSLDVFGGIQYSVEIWAETVKAGPALTGTKQVPEYSKYLLFSSLLLLVWAPMQGTKSKFEFGSTCATRCKFLVALPKF